jgi:hypothetical protein
MERGEAGLRGWTLPAIVAACGLLAAGCGSSSHFTDFHRPPTPVDLTVYVNNHHVSVSPSRVGAGPVIFYVTNQATQSETVTIGSSQNTTGPINPDSSARIQVDLPTGEYLVKAGPQIAPATLHIGKPRPNADNTLLQP